MTTCAAGGVKPSNGKRSLLHVGAGYGEVPEIFSDFAETRLDIDPQCEPDLVADMADLSCLSDGSFDAIYSCHSLEHLCPDEVRVALKEFQRVLKAGGFVIIIVPDLEGVQLDNKVLYTTPVGEITGRDLHYGYGPMAKTNPYMVHRSGFMSDSLRIQLQEADFSQVGVKRAQFYNLIGVAIK